VSDMAREGLFSSIASDVPGATVLDLYAGTGALGIEALSRGAERAAFVERSRPAQATIWQNLDRTALADRAVVIASPVAAFLTRDRNGHLPERPRSPHERGQACGVQPGVDRARATAPANPLYRPR